MATKSPAPRRGRRPDGERTHAAILDAAARLASVEGIHGLTLGRLAEVLGVSKSGLYAHFGSKEQLQLETIEAAQSIFEEEVVQPALAAPDGLPRLEASCESYLSYIERDVFPGGCFFASMLAELDARSGPLHDRLVATVRAGAEGMASLIREAQRRGELAADVDVEQLAFQLQACLDMTNYHYVLFKDPKMIERGRKAVSALLDHARPATGRRPTSPGRDVAKRRR